MKFKSYAGKDLAEIVPRIREELGPDAVILKQRQTAVRRRRRLLLAPRRRGAGRRPRAGRRRRRARRRRRRRAARAGAAAAARGERPTAARAPRRCWPRRSPQALQRARRPHRRRGRAGAAPPEEEDAMPAARHAARAPRGDDGLRAAAPPPTRGANAIRLDAVPRPERGLHIAPLPVFARGDELDEEGADLLLELERAGVSGDIARRLVDEVVLHVQPFSARPLRELARDRIAARIRTEQGWTPDGSPRRIAIVGPTGVGKTAAVVRLAAAWAEAGLSVGLVTVAPELSERAAPADGRGSAPSPAPRPTACSRTSAATTWPASPRRWTRRARCSASPTAT